MNRWEVQSIGDLCERITSGGTPSRSRSDFYLEGTIPWVKTGELRDGYIESSEEKITQEAVSNSSAKILPPGTVLMAMYGATVGALGVLRVSATCNQASCALITDPAKADARWLYYALLNDRDRIVSQATGAAQQNLSGKTIRDFQYLTPSLPEQQAIAEVLGALDDKIAANTRLAAAADELAGVTYDEFVRTWKRSSMSKVLSPVLGGTPSRANEDFWSPASDLWISARDITSAPSRVVLDTVERISPLATASTKSKPLPAGSVILTARGTVGAVARLARPAAFNQSCYGFAPTHVPAGVLFFSVLRAAEHARKIAHGSVFDTITMSTFDHLEMAWDPGAAPELEAQLSPLLRAIDGAIEENRTLAATRDALLPKLMSGQLRVRDTEKIVESAGA